jgi:hypothetical protein
LRTLSKICLTVAGRAIWSSSIRSLNVRCIAQKTSERDGVYDLVSGIGVLIHGLDAIAKTSYCIVYAFRSKSWKLAARYGKTFVGDSSPFARIAYRFDVGPGVEELPWHLLPATSLFLRRSLNLFPSTFDRLQLPSEN